MPRLDCPVAGCAFQTQELDAALEGCLTALTAALGLHAQDAHARVPPVPPPPPAGPRAPTTCKPQQLTRPSIGSKTTAESWQHFTTFWDAYKGGTGPKTPVPAKCRPKSRHYEMPALRVTPKLQSTWHYESKCRHFGLKDRLECQRWL